MIANLLEIDGRVFMTPVHEKGVPDVPPKLLPTHRDMKVQYL